MFNSIRTTALVALLLLLSGCDLAGKAATAVFQRAADNRMGDDMRTELVDGLHLALCGAGSPMPDPKRSGPCIAVIAGDSTVIIDSGSGSSRNLSTMSIPQGDIDAVLLTHFHSDHIDGLGELAMNRWVQAANNTPLPVFGPAGVNAVVSGFNQVYAADARYRQAHHSDSVAPLSGAGMTSHEFQTPEAGQTTPVFNRGDLVISAFRVDHDPVSPAVGYRLEYKGRSLVISGDTAKSENLQLMSQDVDLLVHEALSKELVEVLTQAAKKKNMKILEKITVDIIDYHTSPIEAAQIAAAAGVDHLLYYHIVPGLVLPGMEAAFTQGVDDVFDGEVTVGIDGTLISLPANSQDIIVDELL
ncbi:MAG: ribonuclease Z [Cellvibrionaceae bacterium]|nr:ribonuclease Z [Cellvibrionaceae bacterium]|tara:strand:- start:2528 stop:3601 length:1074 start_codon:yes stop_codon:yes gene_type:complete